MTTYIEEIIDNFYNTRLAERIVFLEILNEAYEQAEKISEEKYPPRWDGSNFSINRIPQLILLTKIMFQFQRSEAHYNVLTEEQKKELQTQIYLKSRYIDDWTEEPLPRANSRLNQYNLNKIDRITDFEEQPYEKYQDKYYRIDFSRLMDEVHKCLESTGHEDLALMSSVDDLSHRYFEYTFDLVNQKLADTTKEMYIETCIKPISAEYNYSKRTFDEVLHKNINAKTAKIYDSLNKKEQFEVAATILNIDVSELDYMIACRKQLRKSKKETQKQDTQEKKVYEKTIKREKNYFQVSKR